MSTKRVSVRFTRLVEEGLAVCIEMAQDRRPDKKVYNITANGTEALAAALRRPAERDKMRSDSLFILMFGHPVPPAQLQRLME